MRANRAPREVSARKRDLHDVLDRGARELRSARTPSRPWRALDARLRRGREDDRRVALVGQRREERERRARAGIERGEHEEAAQRREDAPLAFTSRSASAARACRACSPPGRSRERPRPSARGACRRARSRATCLPDPGTAMTWSTIGFTESSSLGPAGRAGSGGFSTPPRARRPRRGVAGSSRSARGTLISRCTASFGSVTPAGAERCASARASPWSACGFAHFANAGRFQSPPSPSASARPSRSARSPGRGASRSPARRGRDRSLRRGHRVAGLHAASRAVSASSSALVVALAVDERAREEREHAIDDELAHRLALGSGMPAPRVASSTTLPSSSRGDRRASDRSPCRRSPCRCRPGRCQKAGGGASPLAVGRRDARDEARSPSLELELERRDDAGVGDLRVERQLLVIVDDVDELVHAQRRSAPSAGLGEPSSDLASNGRPMRNCWSGSRTGSRADLEWTSLDHCWRGTVRRQVRDERVERRALAANETRPVEACASTRRRRPRRRRPPPRPSSGALVPEALPMPSTMSCPFCAAARACASPRASPSRRRTTCTATENATSGFERAAA